MNIQELLDKMSEGEMYKRVATGQNMSLGALIDALKPIPPESPVVGPQGMPPLSLGSYRGYYSDLAIEFANWSRSDKKLDTVGKLLDALEAAVGTVYEGYKGGEFTMQAHTPMWWASYGDCGEAIHGIELKDGTLHLITIPDSY